MSDNSPLRVMIVDDVPLYAKIISSVIEKIPNTQIVGVAHDGAAALIKAAELKPDLMTLDVEMPKLDGLEVLSELKRHRPETGVIMVSGLSSHSAALTAEALKLGAFDFVVKPQSQGSANSLRELEDALRPQVEAFARSRKRMKSSFRLNERVAARPAAATLPAPTKKPIDLVLIASSTGGPAALREVLSRLPQSFPYPVIIAQHMPPSFTTSLAQSLDRDCPLKVVEAAAGSLVAPGHVYLLPGGIQTRLTGRLSRMAFETVTGPADGGPRPSANLLFESATKCTDGRVLAVVLTGMGEDGKEGCQQLRQLGATILAQDEASCVVYGMPRAIADAGLADDVAPLNQIAARIQHFTGLGNSRLRATLPAADSGKLPFDQGVLR